MGLKSKAGTEKATNKTKKFIVLICFVFLSYLVRTKIKGIEAKRNNLLRQ
jgi:hypothetical protein